MVGWSVEREETGDGVVGGTKSFFFRLFFLYCGLMGKCFLGQMGSWLQDLEWPLGKNLRAITLPVLYPGLMIHPRIFSFRE